MRVGHIAKAITAGGLIWADAPEKGMNILTFIISSIPGWPTLPMDVQDSILWFVAGGVASFFGWVVYRVPNDPMPSPQPQNSGLGLLETRSDA